MTHDEPPGPPDPTEPADRAAPDGGSGDYDESVNSDDLAVSAYLDGVASAAEAARVETDPALQRQLARYRSMAALLGDDRRDLGGAGPAIESELAAALDRARAVALAEMTADDDDDRRPARPGGSAGPALGGGGGFSRAPGLRPRRLPRQGRWAVQVLGLAAAVLVAVGALAVFRSPSDDDGQVEGARAGIDEPVSAQLKAEGGAEAPAAERRMSAQGEPSSAAAEGTTPPAAGTAVGSVPVLGSYATVDDLLARLDTAPLGASTTAVDAAGSTGPADPTGPTGPATTNSTCAPRGADILGMALVAGQAVLVIEVGGAPGESRLVGLDPADCRPLFDRSR